MDSASGLPPAAVSPEPDHPTGETLLTSPPAQLTDKLHTSSPCEVTDKLHSASTPVDVARPLSRQKVSASLEKLLGAGLSPTGRPSSYGSRERSSSREGLSSSGDELSPARETRDMDLLATSGEYDRANVTNRSSVFEESWNPLEDDDDRPARPKSCDALSAGSLPLTSSDSRSRDELVGTGLDSTEDELDSGIMDDDLPVEMRRRHRSLSDRSSSRSLEDQLDFACVESGPRLSSEAMRHRIQLSKQSVKNRRKPTRAGRRSHEHSQHSAIQEVTPQRDSLDPSLLSRGTTPPISPSILRKTSPSPRPRQTPPTTPGRSPVPSPRPTPPATRARLGRDHSPSTPEEHVVKSASSPTVSLDTVQPGTSPTLLPSMGASISPISVSMTPPAGPVVTPPAAPPPEPSPVMTPPGIVTSSLTSRPRSAAEPLGKDSGFMSELKRRTASKEDLTSPRPLTPRKAVLPAISPSNTQAQKIDGAVTDETKDSLSPEPKSNQKPKFDTSPLQPADIRTKPESPRSQTPDLKPKAKPKPNLPPKSSSPTWFDKLRLRKKAASIDVPEPEVETKTKSPEPKVKRKSTEATSTVTVVQPVAQKATDGTKDASQGGTPPWLRETRLRRSASKSDEKKESSEPKPSWMREVLARRRKTQEKLNVGDLAEPADKSPQEKSTPKKTLSPLKTNTESDNKNNNMDKTAKNNNKNIVSKTLFKENREKDKDFDSGTSSCEQSPLRRPTSLQKRDENVPPPSTTTSSATTTQVVTSQSSRTSGATEVTSQSTSITKTSPLPPISKAASVAGEREIDTSVPAWKAELAIRKSQRKISVPKTDSDQPSAEVPQWKRELMEKKRARSVPQEEDPSLAGLPPWKQELMRKKKERSSPNCGVIDAQQDQSQC